MKVPIFRKKRCRSAQWMFPLAVAALLLFGSAVAFATTGGEHSGEGAKGWVATDTYRVMNFAVLAIGLFLVLKKPVSQALGGRIQGIKEQLAELEGKKKAAEAKLAEYDAKMAELDKEAETMLAEYVKQGEDAKARILKEAESAAEKLKEQATKNIEHEFLQAKAELKAVIVEKALAKAEAIIKEKINSDDQEKLVDEYLAKVVA
ncbi:ATP synthase F0 subunit B [uncultured Desulfosarcina sp.]|uniref:ATP synthase F0 subunit B n=1 Tax=uncultured Desulfosarcina sp. TaxID=218289 RepID=UPI0029C7B513|nr:ATP synthase F0 subunit B [uncultured Desulfosarcina sp.]